MQRRIPKPFSLLLFFFFLSNYLSASPDCPIVNARFPLADGTTSDPSATGWYLNSSNVASTGYFAVKSNRLHAQELGGEGIWYSRVFSNPGYSEFQVAVKVSSEGDMNSSEYVKIYYKINGGAETLLEQRTGNFGTIDFISPVLTGSNVQLVVKLYNYNNGGSQTSKYYIEEYRMFKEKGPCTVSSGITVTAAAANGGVLTCASPSLGLSATATGTGTTTWSWTGPNGYTSTTQNPVITTAGTYTAVATNSTGTGSASVTVTENKTAPVITATGGALACGSCVSISATSNVSGATYSWSGPGNFTSTSQNPTVCAAGTYTVTVTNPANGCSAQQSVTVSASTASTFWLEEFTGLSNGTTSDAGATAWTTSVTGSGTYSVQNNEFKVSFSGSQGVGIWTSQVIDISSRSNVSFSVNLRSEVASSSDALENADYIRVYYKLNGGAETLVFEDLAGIGSTTNTTASTTFNSSTLNGSTLQVIIKTSNSDPTERYFFDNIKLTGSNAGTTTVTPAVTGTVTCTAAAQLSATATGTVTAWSWTGPNGFASSVQNPAVNAGGQYIVTATFSSGCTASATITVPENKTLPDITASGGSLACLSVITLNVNSTVANATYSWTGPNNFTSNSKNPTVSVAGTYVATVTNPANGCTAQQSVSVTSGTSTTPTTFWLEDFSGLSNGTTSRTGAIAWTATTSGSGTYSVQSNEFKTTFSGQAEGVWTSQAINIAGKSNVTFSVDLRSETPGTDAFENADYIRVYYKLNGGAETLVYEDLAGVGTTTNGTASVTVTSAALNGSTLQLIVKTSNSDPTERYYFDNVKLVGSDITGENVTATGGAITCTSSSVTLLGNAASGGVSYSWTGPNNFASADQNPVVSATGIYTLTVHNPATGCNGIDTAIVVLNTTAPGATASASGSLSCSGNSSVTLSGSSSTTGVSYSWTGPNNFTSSDQNPVVTTAGTYNLTVTNIVNGCTSNTSVVVTMSSSSTGAIWLENFTMANGTTSDAGATSWSVTTKPSTMQFAVLNNEMRSTNSTTQGEGVWTSGVINIAGKTNVTISAGVRSSVINGVLMNNSGELADYLRFYYKLNNGAEVLFDERMGIINNHSTTPTAISVSGLSGTSLQIVVRTRATANDEFYYFDNVQVVATTPSAIDAVATATDVLTCTKNTVGLTGSTSATSPVNYSWTGPANFTSSVQNPSATMAGIYTLTVTDQSTGCTGSDTALVSLNNTAPNISAAVSGPLTCNTGSTATLSGTSSTAGVTYNWTGPNNFASTTQNPVVNTPGTYYLTVTNPVNGCTSNANVFVTFSNTITGTAWLEDFTLPNGTSTDNGTSSWSTAINPSTTLFSVLNNEFRISNSTTTGEGVWTSGPIDISGKTNISISTQVRSSIINNAVMNSTGEYADYIRFYYKLNNGTEVLFNEKLGVINNHSTTPTPVSINGISGNTLQIVVKARATGNDEFYYFDNMQVVATSAANVSANATGGAINCINNSVALQGSSTATGVSYAWGGPNGYTSTVQNPVVTTPGTYTLTVALGSCTATATATVTRDTTKPAITASANPLQLTCIATTSTLSGNSTTPGVSYSWRNAGGSVIATTPNASINTPGSYSLTVINPGNGCSSTSQVSVSQDTIRPAGITVAHNGTITCITPSIAINATISSGNVNYGWTGPNGYTASTLNASITRGGTYIFTATNPTNGCAATASTVVEENTTPPGEISINNSGIINCLTSSVTISGSSSSSGVNYKWEGPNGYSSSSSLATVMHGGQYTLTATNPANGCTSSKSTIVTENTTAPVITITNNGPITCAKPEVTLTVTSNVANVNYLWLGDDLISDQPTVVTAAPGLYIVTVTNQVNGCDVTEQVEVMADYSDCGARKVTTVPTAKTAKENVTGTGVASFSYKAYPNPVITNGIIEFTSPQSANATVSLYNALGACEKVLFKGNVMANRLNRVSVPATQLTAGAYYYIINSGGRSFTGKLVIVK